MILQAILTFFFRILSGVINKFGYQKEEVETLWIFLIAQGFVALSGFANGSNKVATFLALATMLSSLLKFLAFVLPTELKRFKWQSDIHLWELIMTSFFSLQMVVQGADLVTMCLVMYPALFIHKAVINSAFRQGMMWSVTDDASGKTYALPYLGIKIPRFNQIIRLWLSIFSVLLLIINFVFIHFYISAFDVLKIIQSYV